MITNKHARTVLEALARGRAAYSAIERHDAELWQEYGAMMMLACASLAIQPDLMTDVDTEFVNFDDMARTVARANCCAGPEIHAWLCLVCHEFMAHRGYTILPPKSRDFRAWLMLTSHGFFAGLALARCPGTASIGQAGLDAFQDAAAEIAAEVVH